MEKNTFIEELEKLAQNEDVLMVSREVNELKGRFEDYVLEEERKNQVALLDAQAEGKEYDSTEIIRSGKYQKVPLFIDNATNDQYKDKLNIQNLRDQLI